MYSEILRKCLLRNYPTVPRSVFLPLLEWVRNAQEEKKADWIMEKSAYWLSNRIKPRGVRSKKGKKGTFLSTSRRG